MFTLNYLPYEEITALENSPLFRSFGFPMEYSISIPMPTLRWVSPAYAYFASPTRRVPGQLKVQSAPAFWWAIDARTALLMFYVPYQFMSFAPDQYWEPVTLHWKSQSSVEIEAGMAALPALITQAAPLFFTNQPGDPALRQKLSDTLDLIIPEGLLPEYKALVPDFFKWLGVLE